MPAPLSADGSDEEEYESEEEDDEVEQKTCVDACARLAAHGIVRHPSACIVLWLVTFVVAACFAPGLLGAVKTTYDPLPSMPSGKSKKAFERHYKEFMGKTVDSVLFTLKKDVPLLQGKPVVEEAANSFDHVLRAIDLKHPGMIEETRSWRKGEGAGEFMTSYISRDNRSWLLEVHWHSPTLGRVREEAAAVSSLLSSVKSLNKTYAPMGVDMVVTGEHAVDDAIQEMAKQDVGVHAVMFLPVAIAATHTQLCRWQLLLLPAACCLISLAVSFAFGSWVAGFVTLGTTVPTIMAFLCIALVIDWSFFLLARFREETLKGARHEDAIVTALVNTGSNIALSGFMIFLCSSCMVLMPPAIASNALGGCLVVVAGLAVCLTLLPALLAAAPACFAGRASDCDCFDAVTDDEELEECTAALAPATRRAQARARAKAEAEARVQRSMWYQWARLVTSFPCNLVTMVGLCLLFMPCTLELITYVPAVDDRMATPPDAPAVKAGKHLEHGFAGKSRSKSQMLVLAERHPECNESVKSNRYFSNLCNLSHSLMTLKHGDEKLQAQDFLGVGFYAFPGQPNVTCFPWMRRASKSLSETFWRLQHNKTIDGNILLTADTHFKSDEFMHYHHLYKQLWGRLVSPDAASSVVVMQLPWSAVTDEGFQLVRDLRATLANFRSGSTDICSQSINHEISMPSVWMDYVDASVSTLPKALLLACAITTPMIAMCFCSCVAPLKLLLTVLLPLTWIYGTAIMCFQGGLLDFLGADAVHSHGGLHWSVPCMTAILLLALALDYNIFYFGRVFEYRKDGYSDVESIRRGLVATGPIITTAGVIFAVEFMGMFFSATELNRQGGFVIVTGVLFDTFVIRSVMMPATLSFGARCNWWPYRMPPPALGADVSDCASSANGSYLASRANSGATDYSEYGDG